MGGCELLRLSWKLVLALFSIASVPAFAQSPMRTVHVFVALADNANQGIIPVPAKLGNGEDAERNLFWGSAFGVKTFFSRSSDWKLIVCGEKPKYEVLERCVFKHRTANVYLVADCLSGTRDPNRYPQFLRRHSGHQLGANNREGWSAECDSGHPRRLQSVGLHRT